MSPFWTLVIGIGLIWFISSGRATAIVGALFGPVGAPAT